MGEIATIPLSTRPTWEAGSYLFAVIAYPLAIDENRRELFRIALCKDFIKKWKSDLSSVDALNWLVPSTYVSDAESKKDVQYGFKKIHEALNAGSMLRKQLGEWNLGYNINITAVKTRYATSIHRDLKTAERLWSSHKNVLHLSLYIQLEREAISAEGQPDEIYTIMNDGIRIRRIVKQATAFRSYGPKLVKGLTVGTDDLLAVEIR